MTEPAPDAPPIDPNEPVDPPPTEPTEPEEPPVEEPPAAEEPAGPCGAVHPSLPQIVCELNAGHFDNRLVHTSHANGTVYEWE